RRLSSSSISRSVLDSPMSMWLARRLRAISSIKRQPNSKQAPRRHAGLCFDRASMSEDDSLGNCEPQAGAARLGRKEWIEYSRRMLRCDARPVIDNLDHRPSRLQRFANMNVTERLGRLHSVKYNIEQYLCHLFGIESERRKLGGPFDDQVHLLL